MEHTNLNSLAQVEINGADLPKELLLSKQGRYATYYAPFDSAVCVCVMRPRRLYENSTA